MPSTNGHGPKRAILYARVSTDEQAKSGFSLAQQTEALRGYAAQEGYEVVEEVTDPVQKVRGLVDMDYGQGRAEGFGVTVDGDAVTLELPDSCKYDQRWFVAKYRLVSDLRAYAGMKTVRFVESYTESPFPTPEPAAAPADEGAPKGELVEEEML